MRKLTNNMVYGDMRRSGSEVSQGNYQSRYNGVGSPILEAEWSEVSNYNYKVNSSMEWKPLNYVDWHLYNFNSFLSRGRASAPSGYLGAYSPTEIRVRITSLQKNIDDDSLQYRKIYGRPLQQFRQLKNLTGFTKCDEFHLENFTTATESEKNQITSLLKSGIIL